MHIIVRKTSIDLLFSIIHIVEHCFTKNILDQKNTYIYHYFPNSYTLFKNFNPCGDYNIIITRSDIIKLF